MKFNQQNDADRTAIAKIDQMSPGELAVFDRLMPKDLSHYLAQQIPWLEDEIYFLGIQLQRAPTQEEIARCILVENHSQRFRAFYALRYSEFVELEATAV